MIHGPESIRCSEVDITNPRHVHLECLWGLTVTCMAEADSDATRQVPGKELISAESHPA